MLKHKRIPKENMESIQGDKFIFIYFNKFQQNSDYSRKSSEKESKKFKICENSAYFETKQSFLRDRRAPKFTEGVD